MTRDRGSISVLMIFAGLLFIVLLLRALTEGDIRVARHRAQNAADAGALAAAVHAVDGPQAACAEAGRLAAANNARLVSCTIDGLDVRVVVETRPADGTPATDATARAGPVREVARGEDVAVPDG